MTTFAPGNSVTIVAGWKTSAVILEDLGPCLAVRCNGMGENERLIVPKDDCLSAEEFADLQAVGAGGHRI